LTKVGTIVKIREYRDKGLTKKATAQRLGLDRKTVAKYWEGPIDDLKKPRYEERSKLTDPYVKYITNRLDEWPELTAERIYREIRSQGYAGSKRTVRRCVAGLRKKTYREYKPVETIPGEQAQVDWGHCGKIDVDGRQLSLYAFAFSLSWSRVRYVEFITSLNMATFFGCMHRALEYVGGVPREIVFDNAKTVVSERVGGVVRYNENLLWLAASYGFSPKACWINDPESKGKVESNIKYVKQDFHYACSYTGLEDLNAQARQWCDEVANVKIHGTTGDIPFRRLAEEKHYLQSLVITEPLFVVEGRKATKTQLISIDGNKYSVPVQFARKQVKYHRFEDRIELLDGEAVIETIELVAGKGKSIVQDRHYPAHSRPKRASHPLQAKFEALSPSAKVYLQGLSQSRTGHLREQMEKIVSLANTYSESELESAMERGIAFRAFGYGQLKRTLEKQRKNPLSLPGAPREASNMLVQYASIQNVEVEQRDLRYYRGYGA
jgi:transposase